MSIELLIEYDDPTKQTQSVPIATEDVFTRYWKPTATRLGLQWVPIFQTGLPLDTADIPFVIQDLQNLKEHLADAPDMDIPEDLAEEIKSRTQMLVNKLQEIVTDRGAEGYIG